MLFSSSQHGLCLSGDLTGTPVPIILAILSHAKVTGYLDIQSQERRGTVVFMQGHVVGLEIGKAWKDRDAEDQRKRVTSLVKQCVKFFPLERGSFSFTSAPRPKPALIEPGQLPSLFLIRYGLLRSSCKEKTERLFFSLFREQPVVRLVSDEVLQLLGPKASKQVEAYLQDVQIVPQVTEKTHQGVLVALWAMLMLEVTPRNKSHVRYHEILAYIRSVEAYQGVEQELSDPFSPSAYEERNEFIDDLEQLEQTSSSASYQQVMEGRELLESRDQFLAFEEVEPEPLLPMVDSSSDKIPAPQNERTELPQSDSNLPAASEPPKAPRQKPRKKQSSADVTHPLQPSVGMKKKKAAEQKEIFEEALRASAEEMDFKDTQPQLPVTPSRDLEKRDKKRQETIHAHSPGSRARSAEQKPFVLKVKDVKPPRLPAFLKSTMALPEAVDTLLSSMQSWKASDLFLTVDKPPAVRIHGQVVTLELPASTQDNFEHFLDKALNSQQKKRFQQEGDLDLGYSPTQNSRFRINLYRQKGMLSLVARGIPGGQFTFSELGLPEETLSDLASLQRGLILVTGATGSGKSTTLAALVHHINTHRQGHIVTIEEPIEFLHTDRKSRVTQREVGADTASFETALRHVVRESPDVILIGEMRDRETMNVALSAALTGHLVLASVHTIDTGQTLQRIMSYYPEHLRHQVAMDLSLSLRGIVSQRLLPQRDGKGRVMATEILTMTPAAVQLLRQERMSELADLMKNSGTAYIHTFNHSLLGLFRQGKIDYSIGKAYATNPDEFALAAQGMETGIATFNKDKNHDSTLTGLDMKSLLKQVLRHGASDLHLTSGRPPILRLNGELKALPYKELTEGDMRILLHSILNARQRTVYELEREVDFAISLEFGPRFRVNAYHQKGRMAASLRLIPDSIPDPEVLEIPESIMQFVDHPHGLVLVVGPTGSGKSTTLACMIDRINQSRSCRIITVEDPIEFTHRSIRATVDQREINADTKDFNRALRNALRQDPDVLLIGEMRDLETISAAITAAETGHLVLATLHTNNAVQTIDRIVDAFPSHQQSQIRSQLASALLGVVSQRLLPRMQGGRIGAFEVMVASPAIRNLIREDKMHQAQSLMETSRTLGMNTMDHSIRALYERELVDYEDAVRFVHNPDILT